MGKLKLKGAYFYPDPSDYFNSISEMQPPGWHRDFGNLVSIKAAVAAMVHGIDPEAFIRFHADKFDFMLRVKVGREDKLMLGDRELQRNTRYYVARNGQRLKKIAHPPKGASIGQFKRASKVPDAVYSQVMNEIGPGVWDARIHTKNKSTYEMRETNYEAGYLVCECNRAADFQFDNVDYSYYVAEARKLIIN